MKTDKKLQETILSNQLRLTEMAIDAIDLLTGMVRLSHKTVYMVLGEPEELKPEEANEAPPLAENLTAQSEDTDAVNKPEKVEPYEAKKVTGTCSVCGKEFLKKTSNQKCCSPECRAAKDRLYQIEYKQLDKRKTKICEICGKEFEAKRNQKYCSPECQYKGKMKWQNERRAEARAAEAKQIEDLTAPLAEHNEKMSIAECQRIDREHGVSYGDGERLGLHRK